MAKYIWIYVAVTLTVLVAVASMPNPQMYSRPMGFPQRRTPNGQHTSAQEGGGEGGEGGEGNGGGKKKKGKSGPILNVGFNLDLGEIFQKIMEKLGQAFGNIGEKKQNKQNKKNKENGDFGAPGY